MPFDPETTEANVTLGDRTTEGTGELAGMFTDLSALVDAVATDGRGGGDETRGDGPEERPTLLLVWLRD